MKLEIKNISKQYGKKTVLQGVSQEFSGGVYIVKYYRHGFKSIGRNDLL